MSKNKGSLKIYTPHGFYVLDLNKKTVTNYSESWYDKDFNKRWRDYIKNTYGITKYEDSSNIIVTYNTKRMKNKSKEVWDL